MVISIKIPDELYEKIGKLNPQNPRYAVEKLLEKYAEAGYSARTIILVAEDLKHLQELLGQVNSPAELLEKISKAISIKVEGVEVNLSEGQRKRAASNAKFWNQSQEEYIRTQVTNAVQRALGV